MGQPPPTNHSHAPTHLLGGLVHAAEHHEEEAALDVHVPEDVGRDAAQTDRQRRRWREGWKERGVSKDRL